MGFEFLRLSRFTIAFPIELPIRRFLLTQHQAGNEDKQCCHVGVLVVNGCRSNPAGEFQSGGVHPEEDKTSKVQAEVCCNQAGDNRSDRIDQHGDVLRILLEVQTNQAKEAKGGHATENSGDEETRQQFNLQV